MHATQEPAQPYSPRCFMSALPSQQASSNTLLPNTPPFTTNSLSQPCDARDPACLPAIAVPQQYPRSHLPHLAPHRNLPATPAVLHHPGGTAAGGPAGSGGGRPSGSGGTAPAPLACRRRRRRRAVHTRGTCAAGCMLGPTTGKSGSECEGTTGVKQSSCNPAASAAELAQAGKRLA